MKHCRGYVMHVTVLVLCFFSADLSAQWGNASRITLHRGQIAHSIHNPGMSGKKDNETKLAQSSFSYPMGRALRVYSGGSEREGWNAKSNSAGEGIWILSKTGGVVHGSYVGSRVLTTDVQQLDHDMSTEPEAYLGVVHHPDWALALRTETGQEAAWTRGPQLANATQTYWPAASGVSGKNPRSSSPVSIWNFRFGRYNTEQPFQDRVAAGELDPLSPPAWAAALSEDDFPEVVGITRAMSSETGLKWTRKWYQWGHVDYDDFLINETVVENTSGTTQEGVYIVLENRLLSGAAVSWRNEKDWHVVRDWARDDHVRSTLASNYLAGHSREAFLTGAGKPVGAQIGKDLADAGHAMVYVHDGESDHIDNAIADVGDPYRYDLAIEFFTRVQTWVSEGYIQHGQYFGLGVIDALPPFNTYGGTDAAVYVGPYDNGTTPQDESLSQPASVSMWQYTNQSEFEQPSPTKDTHEFIYDTVTQAGHMDEPDGPDAFTQLMTFGPYTLGPGEKCKVVVAYVGGFAADQPKYADYKRYAQPFNVAWMNLYNGPGQPAVSFAERQREIPLGEDVMFSHFQNAIDIYNWGYDVPNQPPNIKLGFKSTLDGNPEIYWSAFGEEAVDPDYVGDEGKDLRGYRIYKSTVEYQGPWEFVSEISFEDIKAGNLPSNLRFDPTYVFHTVPDEKHKNGIPLRSNRFVSGIDEAAGASVAGTYFYVDADSEPGSPVWYSVRYYDSGHADWNGSGREVAVLESSPGPSGGAVIGNRRGLVSVVPMRFFDGGFGRIDSLFYPRLRAGDVLTQKVRLENQSNYDLVVNNISASHTAFQPLQTTLSIPSGEMGEVDIVFTGHQGDLVNAGLMIESTGGHYSLGLVEVASSAVISTTVGGGKTTFPGFVGSSVALNDADLGAVRGITIDAQGHLYISGTAFNVVYRMGSDGHISVFAGNETTPRTWIGRVRNYSGDGSLATKADLGEPFDLATDRIGNLYIAERANHRIRKVNTAGVISTVAGTGVEGHTGDGGPAVEATLKFPMGVAIGPNGEIYIAESEAIRKVSVDGIITTVAGKPGGDPLVLGDGGPATEAYLNAEGLFVDDQGILYIADTVHHRIRKVDTDGIITTIAGDGFVDPIKKSARFAGDGGPATLASLNTPRDVLVDGAGHLFILDSRNNRVRKVDDAGVITTVAGHGPRGFFFESDYSGDGGAALGAGILAPHSIAIDREGNLMISTWGKRVRKIEGVATAPTNLPELAQVGDVSVSDFNDDGQVGFADFISLSNHFGMQASDEGFDAQYDLNADGQIDFSDFLIFASSFGKSAGKVVK